MELMDPAEHFDPVDSCPQWVRGPQSDPASYQLPAGGEDLWPSLDCDREYVPVYMRRKESGQTIFTFIEGKPKP